MPGRTLLTNWTELNCLYLAHKETNEHFGNWWYNADGNEWQHLWAQTGTFYVNLVLCLNFCFGLSCCSQEKFSDKSLMNYWFIFKWVVTNLIFRVKVYCQMWGNSSFKEKDNEDGGKSKAFEPNVQISYEELIINIKKYVLWKKKTWQAKKLLLSENWLLCLMKAFPTPNFWVHFVLKKERKKSTWIQTHVKDCTMVALKQIS